MVADALGQLQQEGKGHLGDGFGPVTGHIGNSNVTFAGGDDVYNVYDATTTKVIEAVDSGTDTIQSWYSIALPSDQYVENLSLMGTGNLNGAGNDLDNLITGNSGSNIIDGGRGNDTFTGGGGADTFVALKGTGMKTFAKKMTEHQMWDTVNYIRSIGPKPSN